MRISRFCLILVLFSISAAAHASRIRSITATKDKIVFDIEVTQTPLSIVELAPYQSASDATNTAPLAVISKKGKTRIAVPAFDGARDRIYSGFVVVENSQPIGPLRFVENFEKRSANRDSYPRASSKKGLQVQMVNDALALGVRHAAFNFNFGQLIALKPKPDDLKWESDGKTFYFHRAYIEGIDKQIKPFSDVGALVSLILLNYQGADTNLNKILLHPNYNPACPAHLSAFNTSNAESLSYFKAAMEFLAARYSEKSYPNGRVVNYIIGNEVNSHWDWANMGNVSMQDFARDYVRVVRISDTAVRKYSSTARVFISLEHHWSISNGTNRLQEFPGREFVDYFNQLAKEGGDFDWHLAYHPYPENLFQPRTWNDKSATFDENTKRITFKNLEVLTQYFRRKEMLFNGKPRRIILSEQGFHSDGTREGELAQAAGYAYAWYRIERLDGIDAFILHRHVDHPHEGGLNLGLWRRDPLSKKPIYDVFRAAGTPEWKEAFEFALPIIGIKSWKEIDPNRFEKSKPR